MKIWPSSPATPHETIRAALALIAGGLFAGAGLTSCSSGSSSSSGNGGSSGTGTAGASAAGTGAGAAAGALAGVGGSSAIAGAGSGTAGTGTSAAGASNGTAGAGSGSAGAGGVSSSGGAGNCGSTCASAPVGSCTAPQVRVSSVSLNAAVNYSTDETDEIPLALAAQPNGGSRLAWMTGYAHYGSSTTSQVHVSELDCDDKLVGTPFTLPAHDFQDIAADANGGVVMVTRDSAGGPDAQHCGDVNNLCVTPSDRPGCYDTYMVRYDCSGNEQWATKLTTSSAAQPGYTSGSGDNLFVWWYQHHGRIASDGTNYAGYFCDAITVTNNQCSAGAGKVDIHEGDRMQVVGPTGALLTGHDSFGIGCSHSWVTRMTWDPRTNHFVMVCTTDNDCRIAQPNPYRTIATSTNACDGKLFGGDVVLSGTAGYWVAWSDGGNIKLEHFTTGASDKTIQAGSSQHPHLVSYGTGHMLLTWGSGSGMAAQVYDSSTGAPVGAQFTIAVPDHPWQSWKSFPDGSVAWAGVASSSATVQIARVLPCTN